MMIKKLVTFEDLGFVQWGVLNEAEDGVYGAIALEEAFFTPLPETMLEFIRQGNDGLLALAEKLGLRRDQVMAVGDSGNDLSMIEDAGLGVAMGNATPEILAAADAVTADNNHDGVALAIEKYALHR